MYCTSWNVVWVCGIGFPHWGGGLVRELWVPGGHTGLFRPPTCP